jgi:HEAT repeat protein
LGTSVASPILLQVAQNNEDPDVRFTAISVLKSCGEVDCIPVLKAIAKKDDAKTIDGRTISREAANVAEFLNQKFDSHA